MTARAALRRALALWMITAPHPVLADWSRLAAWDGRYPSDRTGSPSGFFTQPDVAKALSAVLPGGDLPKLLRSLTLADKFSKVDNHLLTSLCRPHDCGAENATFVFDLDGSDLWVAVFEHRAGSVSITWRGTRDYVDLPTGVLAAVLAVRRPQP